MKKVSYVDYLKQHPKMVVLHVQPKIVEIPENDAELKKWESFVRDSIGLPPLRAGTDGVETQTRCSDPGGLQNYPCDCDWTGD